MARQRTPLEITTIGQPTPEAIQNFVDGWAALVVRVVLRQLAEGTAEMLRAPDGSKMIVSAGNKKQTDPMTA